MAAERKSGVIASAGMTVVWSLLLPNELLFWGVRGRWGKGVGSSSSLNKTLGFREESFERNL